MSSFLSSMIAPHKDGTVLIHVPLQVLTPDEARVLVGQIETCADLAEKGQGATPVEPAKPSKLRSMLGR